MTLTRFRGAGKPGQTAISEHVAYSGQTAQPLNWTYTVERLPWKLATMKAEQAHVELCPKEKAPGEVYTKVSFHDPLEDCLEKGKVSYFTLEDQERCLRRKGEVHHDHGELCGALASARREHHIESVMVDEEFSSDTDGDKVL